MLIFVQMLFMLGKHFFLWKNNDSEGDFDSSKSDDSCYDNYYDDYCEYPPREDLSVYEKKFKGVQLSEPFLERFKFAADLLSDECFSHFRKVCNFDS